MDVELSLKEMQRTWHGSLKSYLIGFIASLLLTSISFYLVMNEFLSAPEIIYTISALALTQAIVQLVYFLNLGKEDKPHWESIIFFFMLLILLIITCGSIWIMHDLKQRTMSHHIEKITHE
jgi:cytochrome o ubiquinol oxidase subunit IV